MPTFSLSRLTHSTVAPTSVSTPPVSFKTRQNRASAVRIAETLEKDENRQSLANLVGFSGALASHLEEMRGAELSHDSTIVNDLCRFREGLDRLRQEADALSGAPNVQARSIEKARGQINTGQEMLNRVIADCASNLHGEALKNFMKGLYPDPDQLMAQAERILPLPQQCELVDQSKRLQRHTGIGNPANPGNWLELAKKELSGKPRAKSLSWAATRTTDASRQKRGIGKLEAAYRHLQDNGLHQEAVSALESLVNGFDNLHSDALRQQTLATFYTNIESATPQERGALLIPLFSNRANLSGTARQDFDLFVDRHFGEAIDALPSANKRPDLQLAIIDQARQDLLQLTPTPELAQRLGHVCGMLEDTEVRAHIGVSLMVAAEDELRIDETLRNELDAVVRDTLPDMAVCLPKLDAEPMTRQMITTLLQNRLSQQDLPRADKRKLLQSVALALPELERHDGIHTALLNAFRPHVTETIAALPAMKADTALQDAMLNMLHKIHVQHQTNKVVLSVQERKEIADALASTYTAHLERSPGFAEMRMRFVDDEVRKEAAANPRETIPFSMEHHVMDLTQIPPDEDEEQGKTSSSTRKGRILDIEEIPRYAKEIAYGPRSASSEAAATKLLAATGLPAPKISLARYDHRPQAIVSQLIPDFKDLGKFVLDEDIVKPMIEKEWGKGGLEKLDAALQKADKATKELEKLEELYPTIDKNQKDAGTVPKQDARRERYQARKSIYQMLPAHIQQTMAKEQFMSQWIGDVDFLNNEWFNAGPKGALDEGNCLLSGFKGKEKDDDNLQYVNVPARADDFYKVNKVLPGEHAFGDNIGPSRTNVGRIGRSFPVADAVPDSIRAETRLAEYGGTTENMTSTLVQEEHALTGQLEGAFQLSLFTDEAIKHLVVENWPEPDNKDVPYKEEDDQRPTAEEMTDYLMKRRDALVAKFTPEERAKWIERNPSKAKAAYHQAAAAIADYTGIYIKPYEVAKRGTEERLRAMVKDIDYGSALPTTVKPSSTVSL